MAFLGMTEFTPAGLGASPVAADTMFELGMMYASGREVAAEMQDAEIGQAQRAARDWLKAHPEPVVQQPMVLRAAA